MTAKIPAAFRDLISTKKTFAHLATVSPGGQPQVTPVWIDADGDLVLVNSAKGRVKDRNMRRHAPVALSILDPDNPYRHLAIRGRVVAVTEQGAEAHIDRLAKKYLGLDTYPNRKPGERRVIYKIEPLSVATMG
jgi:PPOX class probable F420-dependent enzyme